MRITLIGYGKMGKTIEQIARDRGHEISHIIDLNNQSDLFQLTRQETDAAIEFTQPESAFENLKYCVKQQIPVVSGTTGWLERKPELERVCQESQGAFFYASNFSIGVNIFFKLNQFLAKLMSKQTAYQIEMEEIHHTEKKDAPSGTAITLAEAILEAHPQKQKWINEPSKQAEELSIISKREPQVPGTHQIVYQSEIDRIEIKHEAFSRNGFALGAVLATEWLQDKTGVFGMDDMLDF